MISNQIDEAINKSLSQNLTTINFKLLGSSNGLVISKILGDKSMVFINAVIVNDRLGYDLNIITLDSEDKSISDRKPLLTVPLVYSGILAKHYTEKLGDIARVEIQMQQCREIVENQTIFAVKISTSYKNNPKSVDKLSLLIINPEQLQGGKLQGLHLLQIKCTEDHIQDFCWHPLTNLTLLVLTQNQYLQIWNLQQQDFIKPTQILKLKNYKNSQYTSLNIKFTSFAIPSFNPLQNTQSQTQGSSKRQPKQKQPVQLTQINYHKFTLFLMNSIGDIISIFPFMPVGTMVTIEQYAFVLDGSKKLNPQIEKFTAYVKACDLQLDQQHDIYISTKTPSTQPTHTHSHHTQQSIQKWTPTTTPTITQTTLSKITKQKYFYKLQIYPIDTHHLLVIQVLHRNTSTANCIKIGLINQKIVIGEESYFNRDDYGNFVYEVVEVHNLVDNAQRDFRGVGSDIRLNQLALDKYQSFYYTENNGLYKLDLSPIYKFIKTNQLKYLQQQNSFSTNLIFELPVNQSIVALACDQNINNIFFIRRTKNKIKFQNQSLTYLNTFSEVQQINRLSSDLTMRLNNLKSQYGRPVKKQENRSADLNVSPAQLKIYEEKGIELFKKDYEKYCSNLNYSIDQGMSKLKTNYEAMKKRLRNFSDFKNKRNHIDRLLREVEDNNEEINKLLFENKSIKSQPTGEVAELAFSIDSLNNVFETAKNKKTMLEQIHKKTMVKQIDYLLNRLRATKKNLDEAKKIKKDYQDQLS